MDELQEKIAELEDYVQSSDIAAMQSTWLALLGPLSHLIFFHRTVIIHRYYELLYTLAVTRHSENLHHQI